MKCFDAVFQRRGRQRPALRRAAHIHFGQIGSKGCVSIQKKGETVFVAAELRNEPPFFHPVKFDLLSVCERMSPVQLRSRKTVWLGYVDMLSTLLPI